MATLPYLPRRGLKYKCASSLEQSGERQLEKVPIADLPRPNPKAMQTLQRSNQKSGFNKLLVDTLKGTAFTVIGDDLDLVEAVAAKLASRLGWFHVSTRKVVAGIIKSHPILRPSSISPSASPSPSSASPSSSEADLEAVYGREALAAAEASVLKGMRTQRKVVVATMPRGCTGLSDEAYDDLFGSIILRVDEEAADTPLKPLTEERSRQAAMAEITLRVAKGKGFASVGLTADDKAKEAMEGLMQLIAQKLNQDSSIVDRKGAYIGNGFKGWVKNMEAEWQDVKPAGA